MDEVLFAFRNLIPQLTLVVPFYPLIRKLRPHIPSVGILDHSPVTIERNRLRLNLYRALPKFSAAFVTQSRARLDYRKQHEQTQRIHKPHPKTADVRECTSLYQVPNLRGCWCHGSLPNRHDACGNATLHELAITR